MKPRMILSVNPGSTSTKITVYREEQERFKETIRHQAAELAGFADIPGQAAYRKALVLERLAAGGFDPAGMDAVVGRGGFLPEPLTSGTYRVDRHMCHVLRTRAVGNHAANLGALIAFDIATQYGYPAFVVDPVSVNETEPLGKVSGLAGISRRTLFHCLNVKAVARIVAQKHQKRYQDMNMVIAHLGGGISVSAHRGGRAVDSTCGLLGEGAFSPERAGTLGQRELLDLALDSGKTRKEVEKMLCGNGGLVSYLGTNDGAAVDSMVYNGNTKAKLVYEAMAYQIAKDIAAQASVLNGQVDVIVLTAGLAYSDLLTGWIRRRVEFIAPLEVVPGEFEHEAMTLGALRVLSGEEQALHYRG